MTNSRPEVDLSAWDLGTLLREVEHPTEGWALRANCRGVDPELFFPERGEPQGDAKHVCSGCTVRVECLAYGLGETCGVWGGMSERTRRELRRKLTRLGLWSRPPSSGLRVHHSEREAS